MPNKPLKSWKSGNISGAIWVNEKNVNGNTLSFKTASLRRAWKKEGDVWRDETLNFRRQDVPKLVTILTEIQRELFLANPEEEVDEDE